MTDHPMKSCLPFVSSSKLDFGAHLQGKKAVEEMKNIIIFLFKKWRLTFLLLFFYYLLLKKGFKTVFLLQSFLFHDVFSKIKIANIMKNQHKRKYCICFVQNTRENNGLNELKKAELDNGVHIFLFG